MIQVSYIQNKSCVNLNNIHYRSTKTIYIIFLLSGRVKINSKKADEDREISLQLI